MKIEIVLVPYDVDSRETPMARGPLELLERGFEAALEEAGIEIGAKHVVGAESPSSRLERVIILARSTARLVARASSRGRFPLILSGGCLAAVGVAQGLQRMARDFSVVWVDAHGDFNTTETTSTGYWDGMALAALCGRSLPEVYKAVELVPVPFRRIVHLGGRAFDPPELEDFERLKVLRLTPEEVTAEDRSDEVQARLGGHSDLYCHVDLDALDPEVAPAVNFPEPDGLSLNALLSCLISLGRPMALTLSGLSFEEVSEAQAKRQKASCLAVVKRLIERAGKTA